MTFDTDERSVAGSRPIDLYVLAAPSGTYHVTSHVVDVDYAGQTYTAITMDRGPQQVAQDLTGREFLVYLPISHPIVQRFCATGIPEHELLVTYLRLQETSSVAFQQSQGFGNGISIDGRMAAIRVPSITDDAMKVRLPVVASQVLCNHILFDARCQIARAGFQVPTTIASVPVGVTLVVGTMGGNPDGWAAPAGEILHNASNERRQVIAQVGTTLTLNMPFVGTAPGDAVTVFASCDHSIGICHDKFNNVVNFGGLPYLNSTANPWAPGGLGIIVQT